MSAHEGQLGRIELDLGRIHESIDKLRDHTDQGFDRLRDHMDQGFKEMRQEQTKTTRWLIGLAVTYGGFILGIITKMTWGS